MFNNYKSNDLCCGPRQDRTAANDLDFQSSALPTELSAHIFEAGVGVKPTYYDFADRDLIRSDIQPYL